MEYNDLRWNKRKRKRNTLKRKVKKWKKLKIQKDEVTFLKIGLVHVKTGCYCQ